MYLKSANIEPPSFLISEGVLIQLDVLLSNLPSFCNSLYSSSLSELVIELKFVRQDAIFLTLKEDLLSKGISVIGKGAHLPEATIVGRNVRIFGGVRLEDYNKFVPSGATIKG